MRFARQPQAGSLLAAASGSATDLRRVKMLAKIGELWDPAAGRCPGAGSEIRMSRNGRFAGPVIGLRFETPTCSGFADSDGTFEYRDGAESASISTSVLERRP
jgi:hypothetical protein